MERLTYDIKVNGVVIAKDVTTLAEAERIKGENIGASITECYSPVVEGFDVSKLTPKQATRRIKIGG